jgi:hypothetical protein
MGTVIGSILNSLKGAPLVSFLPFVCCYLKMNLFSLGRSMNGVTLFFFLEASCFLSLSFYLDSIVCLLCERVGICESKFKKTEKENRHRQKETRKYAMDSMLT